MAALTSVIIVNYNSGQYLAQCVTAVLASTVPVEVFVVDNASTDNSIQQLRQALPNHAPVHIEQNTQNLGFAKANNQAINKAIGDYILCLNPDCFVEPDTLAKSRAMMDEYPNAGMAGVMVCNPDGSEQAGARRSVPSPWRSVIRVLHLDKLFPNHPRFKSFVLTEEPLPNTPIELEGVSGAYMFIRQTALAEVGGLDEGYFLHCEDLDWFMRFREQNWKILFIPQIKVTHIKGACSDKQPVTVLWYKHKGMVRFYRKFFQQRYPWIVMLMVISAVWLRFAMLATLTIVTHRGGTSK
ncbi:glycosyltransferase family 2 protein [Candidatus Albibeggiatoa sp. nov. NOAA]|uniref:glycosyltransferase family 2 protein n=1 Tax=Candidatus Albibeggiatoa sp. nov. NOAA TaxID=3162724 RepID=UPI0032F7612E|nr:glycosyltransferase family 2 protein [Thiotrichaceae bacterium]